VTKFHIISINKIQINVHVRIAKVKLIVIIVVVISVDCNKCWSFTSHTGCNVDREAIKVDQHCNNYVGMINNYLSPKTYSIDNSYIDHLEVYFLNSLGERVNILDKSGINITQALFKIYPHLYLYRKP
jgi:hypothetical protein